MDGIDVNVLVAILSAVFGAGALAGGRAIASSRRDKGKSKPPPPPPAQPENTGRFQLGADAGHARDQLAQAMYEVLERVRTLHSQAVSTAQDRAKDMINKERSARAMENLTSMSILVEEIRDELFRTSGRLETRIEDAVEAIKEDLETLRTDIQAMLDAEEPGG